MVDSYRKVSINNLELKVPNAPLHERKTIFKSFIVVPLSLPLFYVLNQLNLYPLWLNILRTQGAFLVKLL